MAYPDQSQYFPRICTLLVAISLLATSVLATAKPALISIVIDDIGYNAKRDQQAIDLPGPVACAVLPYTPYTVKLANATKAAGKELILHLPLQAHQQPSKPELGFLTQDMGQQAFLAQLQKNLDALPPIDGVNNHMGSLLTTDAKRMGWLMQTLRQQPNLFFLDSRTTAASVAHTSAQHYGVPTTKRDVFLDDKPEATAIRQQYQRLLRLADKYGSALAIGHPYPSTMKVLHAELAKLDPSKYQLVSVRQLIAHRSQNTQNRVIIAQTNVPKPPKPAVTHVTAMPLPGSPKGPLTCHTSKYCSPPAFSPVPAL